MLESGFIGGAEPPSRAVKVTAAHDRSMQVLEYLVAVVAMLAALGLAFLR